MEEVKLSDQRRIGLEELPAEALRAVPRHQDVETAPHGPGLAPPQREKIDHEEQEHRRALVDLDRVARNAVAKIHAPWQGCRGAVGAIRQTREEAAEAANDDADRDGTNVYSAGGASHAARRLVGLHRHDGAGQGAGDAVRQSRRGTSQRVERAREPRPGHGADGERDEVAGTDVDGEGLSGRPEAPPVEGESCRRPRAPRSRVERRMGEWRRRDVNHRRRLRRFPSRP